MAGVRARFEPDIEAVNCSPSYPNRWDNSRRVLRRPLGGWNARQWRREVFGWLWAASLVLLSWGACRALEGVLAVLFGVG